ncbi:unnamed protein product [Ostreobium quekettii]|uniref:methylenetetrahydrofolate reductase (NADH) n=1 Tax=Ostreobium quekettii TaxID=121088 RepID=A0A8S1J633_9CHLO|nr:unnamed protein product [Ostreobium quekettii]|eukprot:evm.model.scf_865.5 EVM.evm.TU.scf_865.5   scf_865:47665-54014(-)
MKIIDKMNASTQEGRTFFSFEYFPPRTEGGVENLFDRMDRMAAFGPLFCDITWGAGGSTAELTLEIATRMQNMVCVETMMHLTCTNMPVEKLNNALKEVKKAGIQNILALRGDPPEGQDTFTAIDGGFACALDLIKHIRKEYGDYFGIGIAGYPEAHPDSIVDDEEKMKENYWRDIHYLKQKVDAGGDFIISQLFYDTGLFLQFVEDCRSVDITVPIIPGIMPIMTYGGFKRMTSFCKTKVPQKITDTLESIKDNDEAIKKYGIKLGTEMCRLLLDSGVPGLHMYTLNLQQSAVSILEDMELVDRNNLPRHLPWRPPTNVQRSGEAVRPIFWSNRPKSYIKRTADWDAFPSGRWGDSQSPAYGTLNDYQFMRRHTSSEKRAQKAREAWGDVLTCIDDVKEVFLSYCKGEINILPWNEMDTMQKESAEIVPKLKELNKKGYLTITSQPRVNGTPSTDSTFGWGRPGGYVYQKAYIEFFVSPEGFSKLQPQLSSAPSISYMAVNSKGDLHSTLEDGDVNAVTWGVFPGKEIMQPTVVDPRSFIVWKDEAFDLWVTEWGALYEDGSQGRKVLESIRDEWYLVSVVDNDFVHGDIFKVFGF